MKIIKYFFEFIFVIILFFIFKIIGFKLSSNLGSYIGGFLGPLFRSKENILSNIKKALPNISDQDRKKINIEMWKNYGRILSEYIFIKKFRNSKLDNFISVEGQEILSKIKETNKPVVFISGHFSNFELMAMHLEKSGIKLAAIYRPLNNFFLNKIMERIRKKYICKNQIKKGINGVREAIEFIKEGTSIAMMIDQRVSEGQKVNFFGKPASTTTLPAQLAIKYKLPIIPVFIERIEDAKFKVEFFDEINVDNLKDKEDLTKNLNEILEQMIVKNPYQWIWTHNRWK